MSQDIAQPEAPMRPQLVTESGDPVATTEPVPAEDAGVGEPADAAPAQPQSNEVTVVGMDLRFNMETRELTVTYHPADLRWNRDLLAGIMGMAQESFLVDAVVSRLTAMRQKEQGEKPKTRIVNPHDVIPPRHRRR